METEFIANSIIVSSMTSVVMFIAGILFVAWLLSHIFTKSMKYRHMMVDLYVIGMIRKFAKEDDINLEEEMKELRRIEKIEKASERSLGWNIETELNEKIQAKNAKIIEEINKKK